MPEMQDPLALELVSRVARLQMRHLSLVDFSWKLCSPSVKGLERCRLHRLETCHRPLLSRDETTTYTSGYAYQSSPLLRQQNSAGPLTE